MDSGRQRTSALNASVGSILSARHTPSGGGVAGDLALAHADCPESDHLEHEASASEQEQHLPRRLEAKQRSQRAAREMPALICRNAREKTPATMRPGRAPSAARMPISRVRRATVNDISAWMPVADSSSTMNEISHATDVSAQFSGRLAAAHPGERLDVGEPDRRIDVGGDLAQARPNASGSSHAHGEVDGGCRRHWQARTIHRRLLVRQRQLPAEVPTMPTISYQSSPARLLTSPLTMRTRCPITLRFAEHVARERLVHDQHDRSRNRAARSRDRRRPTCRTRRRNRGDTCTSVLVRRRRRRSAGDGIDLDLVLELIHHRKPVGKRDLLDTGLRAQPSLELVEAESCTRGERGGVGRNPRGRCRRSRSGIAPHRCPPLSA
jgi:hypothetical protein